VLAMETLMSLPLDKMLRQMRIPVVNMFTVPIITDLLLPLQKLPTQERRLHLDIMTNGGLLTHHIRHTIVIIILTLMTLTMLVAAGTSTMCQI